MKPDRSASSPGASLASSRLASGTTIPMRMVRGRLISRGVHLGPTPGPMVGIGGVVGLMGSPVGCPSASRRCRWVPRSSPVSGSMSSTSNQPPLTADADAPLCSARS